MTWIGILNNDWFDCNNWEPSIIPNDDCDVTIPVSTNYPIINAGDSVHIKTFNVVPNALFDIPINADFFVEP